MPPEVDSAGCAGGGDDGNDTSDHGEEDDADRLKFDPYLMMNGMLLALVLVPVLIRMIVVAVTMLLIAHVASGMMTMTMMNQHSRSTWQD